MISLFWNLYWYERQGDRLALELFPLFDFRRDQSETRLQFLKGLLGFRHEGERRCLKLLYLPWEMCWSGQSSGPADTPP